MRVRTTPEADGHIRAIDEWWTVNRAAAPDLFASELADCFALIGAAPEIGREWRHPTITGIRRILLRATRYHIYFKVMGEDVVILAVWSAVRGRGPSL